MKSLKMSLGLVVFFVAVALKQASAQQAQLIEKVEAKPNEVVIPYEKWRLPNGLTVIINEDHSDPIVHVEVTYKVGSSRESIGKSGFAHFFEHMMFQGSDHVKDEEHFKIVSEAGGTMNGNTNRDRTVYFQTLPSNQLEVALWLESDRMGFLLDAVTQEKFEIQRATVKNEKSQNVENQPYVLAVVEKLPQSFYPPNHPYNWPTIGYVEDLNRVNVQDLKNFFMRWYGPNNAILTIAGDVNSKEVMKQVEKYFGSINRGPEVKKMRVNPVTFTTDQYVNATDRIFLPLTQLVFPTVPNYHNDEAALDLLADIMGDGNNSIFYKNFVKGEKAVQAGVSHPAFELAGEYTISVVSYPNVSGKEIEELIRKTIQEFGAAGITDEELARAKAKFEARIIGQMESVAGKAGQLAQWEMLLGKPWNLNDEIKRYNKVTKEDIMRVFNRYIANKNYALLYVSPRMTNEKNVSVNPNSGIVANDDQEYKGLKYVKPVDNFDRSKKPVAGPAKPAVVTNYYTSSFENGLKIISTKTDEVPKVVVLFNIKGGHLLDAANPKKNGLSMLTASMMNEGTLNYTAEQISAELDKLGSSISFSAGNESTNIVVESLTKNLDATLKLLEEKLLRPRFDAADFKLVKQQTIEGIKTQKNNAGLTAQKTFNSLMYTGILGTYYTGTAKTVESIKLEDVREFYNKYYDPSVTNVTVVGNITEQEVVSKLAFLKEWKSKNVQLPVMPPSPAIEKTKIYLVNKPDAPQSEIRIGYLALPYDATGEYFKNTIMNYTLGGNFNSRINLNLREEKGYTYGARSGFSGSLYAGPFVASASVRASATDSAIVEFMKEMNNYRTNGITDEELQFTKNSINQSDALNYETLDDKTNFLNRILKYNLPKDFVAQQTAIINNIDKNEINRLAKQYLPTEKMVIVVVGDKIDLKKKLEALGYGKVTELEVE